MTKKVEVVWHAPQVSASQREELNGHAGCVVWFTGLSGCGKSTIANLVDDMLWHEGVHAFLLDGDNVRHGLNATPEMLREYGEEFAQRFGLGFGEMDRRENIRRVGAVAELFTLAGLVTLAAFVSPYRRDRDAVRRRIETARPGGFLEVWVDAPLEVCEARDPKGLYRKARAGQIADFTGISAPYEPPERPDLRLNAAEEAPATLAQQVVDLLRQRGLIGRERDA